MKNSQNSNQELGAIRHESKKGRDNKMSKADRNATKQLRKFKIKNY